MSNDKHKGDKSNAKLKQTTMGDFFSKESKKQRTGELKRKSENNSASMMWSSFWSRGAARDTDEYRNGYPSKLSSRGAVDDPMSLLQEAEGRGNSDIRSSTAPRGKKDHEHMDDNYRFYMNEIPSKPDGDFVDGIHANWFGDYRRLEVHHGYIQWLFPIRDTGMNWHAQELQLHEMEKLSKSKKAKKRILMSYKMMLDFYGIKLKDESTGELERADNWKERFKHLNRSYHNYLRITRILKSLGELGFENLKANFVKFILYEGVVENTLDNLIDSCEKYWIGVLRDEDEREGVYGFYEELVEKQKKEGRSKILFRRSPSPEPVVKVKTGVSKYLTKYTKESDSDGEIDMADYDQMDLLADTLPFENDWEESDDEGINGKASSSVKSKKGNLRVIHDMSDSDTEDFNTPDIDESQEASYWNRNKEAVDGELQIIKDTFESDDGASYKTPDTDVLERSCKTENSIAKEVKHVEEDICSDQIDDTIRTKEHRQDKTESCDTDNGSIGPSKTDCDKINKNNSMDTEEDENKVPGKNEKEKTSETANDTEKVDYDEPPMETGDDGNINV